MYRVTRLTNKWYAVDFGDDIDDEAKGDIEIFAREGTPVVIVNDLADMEEFGVEENEITVIVK
jgi:hypothetical protein